ncbi:hypothetical protein FS799_20255 [Agrobacterium vitis]|nr:hypothetical protein [Agrobacterium vitis]MUO69503.1 hypothetical protein [Agrobacterium vitis]
MSLSSISCGGVFSRIETRILSLMPLGMKQAMNAAPRKLVCFPSSGLLRSAMSVSRRRLDGCYQFLIILPPLAVPL